MKTSNQLPDECREEIPEGQIAVDSEVGVKFGFVSARFRPDSWLWATEDRVMWFSMIWVTTPNHGYTQELIKAVRSAGYTVKIPTPLGTMQHIVRKMGFVKTEENTEGETCEVWVLGDDGK